MADSLETSLGYPVIKNGTVWEIDLSHLRIFTGLSVLARIIGDTVIDAVENDSGDISFLYKMNPNINPELLVMQVYYIQIYAKSGVLDNVLLFKEEFHEHLRAVFGTFQRPVWGSQIHPEFYGEDSKTSPPRALVFPFHYVSQSDDVDYHFILERAENRKHRGRFFFRLTIEKQSEATYQYENRPYSIVDDLRTRVFIAGSTKMAESLSEKLQSACKKGSDSYSEENLVLGHVFEQLSKTGIGTVDQINFQWDKEFSKFMLNTGKEDRLVIIKRLFLCLEDNVLCDLLLKGETVLIRLGKFSIYLFLTRLSRVLNFSINRERNYLTLDMYLKRMPKLEQMAEKSDKDLDFSGYRIFLIHHITSEILALLDAFSRLKTEEINVIFVKYSGLVPPAYLDVLLEIPDPSFKAFGLVRNMTSSGKEYFTLSHAYSEINDLRQVAVWLEEKKVNFFEAMKFLSLHCFLKFALKAKQENAKVILIEDGGYLAPLINELSLKNSAAADVFNEYLLTSLPEEGLSFSSFCSDVLVGTVEHTRNGYDRMTKVKGVFGKLFLPAYSIAISNNKVVEESKEVAHSILSAVESILHGQGMVLSQRKIAVLGSAGNIGKFLCEYLLNGRLHDLNKVLVKVDLKNSTDPIEKQYKYLSEISEEDFLSLEMFLGVIGESILKKEYIEKLILNGKSRRLLFASGSTKTVEFSDLNEFLYSLAEMEHPMIGGLPVKIHFERIQDPQSRIDQGGKAVIHFERNGKTVEKILYLMGDLSPINFLFYGVPTETMDMIIAGLTSVSLGLVDQHRKGTLPKPDLYAVDHEIDMWGEKL